MTPATHARFDEIVIRGAYESIGMPRFSGELDADGLAAAEAYVIEQAHEDADMRNGNPVWRAIKQAAYSSLAWILF